MVCWGLEASCTPLPFVLLGLGQPCAAGGEEVGAGSATGWVGGRVVLDPRAPLLLHYNPATDSRLIQELNGQYEKLNESSQQLFQEL